MKANIIAELLVDGLRKITGALKDFAVDTISAGINFESAFAGIEKTVDGTTGQIAALKQGIRDMALEIPSSTEAISEVAESAGQLGIKTENVLEFTEVMIGLGESTNLAANEAAAGLAQFANVTKMSQEDFDRLSSVIVALGNNSATTEKDIVSMAQRIAGTGTANMTDIQRAVRYLYLIKVSYGTKLETFGAKARNMGRFSDLQEVSQKLNTVIIENKSYDALIKQYDRPNTLFYCDPPYFGAEKFYDTEDFVFNQDEHIKLSELLKSIKEKFILSYNDFGFIRELYADCKIEEVERQNNLTAAQGRNKVYKELIISNF